MRTRWILGAALLFPLFALTAIAQSMPGGNNAVDCSDPTMATSSACSGQDSSGMTSGAASGASSRGYSQLGLGGSSQSSSSSGTDSSLQQNYTDINSTGLQGSRYSARIPLPPEPLTEFQKFVASTSGQILPIFGATLFQYAPANYTPLDQIPVPPDYVIGPGDELRIRVWGQVNFNANVRVDRSGEIYLPQVGQIHVAGIPAQVLHDHLKSAIGRIFRNFDLSADVGQTRGVQVYVVGQAHKPGTYTVSSLSTLVDALFASGGPSTTGSMRHILLKRNGQVVTDFDLYDLLVNGDKSHDTTLQSGDVIFIPSVGPQVAFMGSVTRPGIYELRGETTVEQLLKDAGGASAIADGARVSIERVVDHDHRTAMEVGLDTAGLSTAIHDGDILRVLSIVPSYKQTVTLRGNTANPGRFAWHEGMKLSDLIPDRDSLLTRDYWWKRTQLGLPTPDFEPVPTLSAMRQPGYPIDLRDQQRLSNYYRSRYTCVLKSASSTTPSISQSNTQAQLGMQCPPGYMPSPWVSVAGSPGSQNSSQSSQSVIYDPSSGTGTGEASGQGQGLYGDQSGSGDFPAGDPRSLQSNAIPSNQLDEGNGSLAGRQSQVITQNTASATQHTTVTLSAPEIDWDYAVIERMNPDTLKTSLIPFDLGKLVMGHDASQDLLLQPGDVVSVFSQADIHVPVAEQTKFVRLEGEFNHSGIYSVKPGETLRQLVERAGGLAPGAYLYGSAFTRESTRVIQQHRIDEYVRSLQLQILRGNLAQTSSATATAQDIAGASAALPTETELIDKLSMVRATGRMVLEVKPDASGIDSLPDLPLEDGDTFTVPVRPSTVNVVGSVYDQNSFVFADGRRVGDYLSLAGGPNRDADKKHSFVIRADGSVLSREASKSVWGDTFNASAIHPGDTVVVPEKTVRPSAAKGFLEWSQFFSSIAIGAIAVAILE